MAESIPLETNSIDLITSNNGINMDSWIKLLPADKIEQIFDTIELRINNQSKESGGIKLSIPFVLINAIKK